MGEVFYESFHWERLLGLYHYTFLYTSLGPSQTEKIYSLEFHGSVLAQRSYIYDQW